MGRHARTPRKMNTEVIDILARCFEELGGCEAFEKWVKSSPKRLDTFYTEIWIKLLPMKVDTEDHKNVPYPSSAEIEAKVGKAGMSLELLEKLRKMEANKPKPSEHVRVD